MRELVKATELFPKDEIKRFLKRHIPYRLRLLRLGLAVAPARGLIDSAIIEAAVMAGRQLIYFLGLNIEFNKGSDRPVLKSDTSYGAYGPKYDRRTDEVKIVNVGGQFQNLSKLTWRQKRELAEFLHGASKASAHLTEGSGHKLNKRVFLRGCELIIKLVAKNLAKIPR